MRPTTVITIGLLAFMMPTLLVQSENVVSPRSVLDGVYTDQQAVRGESLYAEHCGACHGSALQGMESAPALTGAAFLQNWGGSTVGDLFERARQSMPPGDPGRLSRAEHADVIAYILRTGKYPAGASALTSNTAALKQIRIRPPGR